MKRVRHCDGFTHFVSDRVGVAAEWIQRRGFDACRELLSAFFGPGRVGFPGRPKTRSSNRPCTEGVVRDPADHASAGRTGMGPGVLIDGERVYSCRLPAAAIRRAASPLMASEAVRQETPS